MYYHETEHVYIINIMLQSTTGSTVLTAEDKLDDQTLIKLKILIDEEEVHMYVCRCMLCTHSHMCSYMNVEIKLLTFTTHFRAVQHSILVAQVLK